MAGMLPSLLLFIFFQFGSHLPLDYPIFILSFFLTRKAPASFTMTIIQLKDSMFQLPL
jgi:hypothetical protein